MRILAAVLIALPGFAWAEVEFGASQGRFPVFGPSAEREAYFAERAQAEADRVAALRAAEEARRLQTLEARAAEAGAAEAEAEARAARRSDACRAVVPIDEDGAGQYAEYLGSQGEGRLANRRARRIVCFDGEKFVTLPYPAVRPRSETGVFVGIDRDGVKGRIIHKRPGLAIGIEVK